MPTQSEQCEDPEIVATQATSHCFPLRDREVRRGQIRCKMFCPRFVSGTVIRGQYVCKISRFENSHAARPDLVVTTTTRFHQQKDRDEDRVDWNHEVRIVRRTEDKRERRAGSNDGPVCRCIETVAPGV